MSEPFVPNKNCAEFILPYPEELAAKVGAAGMVFSIRETYLRAASEIEDKDPHRAAELRAIADYYPDTDQGEVIYRDGRGNILGDEDDWDELTDEQKLFRGNLNAAIANVDRIRLNLETMIDSYEDAEDITRVRRELAAISI